MEADIFNKRRQTIFKLWTSQSWASGAGVVTMAELKREPYTYALADTVNEDVKSLSGADPKTESVNVVSLSYDEIAKFLFDYEVEHTVRLIVRKSTGLFNSEHMPWSSSDDKQKFPKLMWGNESTRIRYSGKPYIKVAIKDFQCQFGPDRHGARLKTESSHGGRRMGSKKIGCEARAEVTEIFTLISPQLAPEYIDLGYTSSAHKKLTKDVRKELKRQHAGQAANMPLVWQREFHLSMTPLNSHRHIIGEAAGPIMWLDKTLRERIYELVESGISDLDIIKDNLRHYVENVLFRDRPAPHISNSRFYPSIHTIRNHSTTKFKRIKKDGTLNQTTNISEMDAALQPLLEAVEQEKVIAQGETLMDQTAADQTGAEQSENTSTFTYHYTLDDSQNMVFSETEQCPQQPKSLSSQGCPVHDLKPATLLHTETMSWSQHNAATKNPCSLGPRLRLQSLMDRLNKISNIISDCENMNKLSAALVNIIMMAKTMIPKEHLTELYRDEPKRYKPPRVIRSAYAANIRKGKRDRVSRKPSLLRSKLNNLRANPDYIPLPHRNTVRRERWKKARERKARDVAEKQKAEQLRTQARLEEIKQCSIGSSSDETEKPEEPLDSMPANPFNPTQCYTPTKVLDRSVSSKSVNVVEGDIIFKEFLDGTIMLQRRQPETKLQSLLKSNEGSYVLTTPLKPSSKSQERKAQEAAGKQKAERLRTQARLEDLKQSSIDSSSDETEDPLDSMPINPFKPPECYIPTKGLLVRSPKSSAKLNHVKEDTKSCDITPNNQTISGKSLTKSTRPVKSSIFAIDKSSGDELVVTLVNTPQLRQSTRILYEPEISRTPDYSDTGEPRMPQTPSSAVKNN